MGTSNALLLALLMAVVFVGVVVVSLGHDGWACGVVERWCRQSGLYLLVAFICTILLIYPNWGTLRLPL